MQSGGKICGVRCTSVLQKKYGVLEIFMVLSIGTICYVPFFWHVIDKDGGAKHILDKI